MHALNSIKQACVAAMTTGAPDGKERFAAAADPAFVLEMANAIEALLTYVEKVDDLTARELAREISHRMAGEGPEGAV